MRVLVVDQDSTLLTAICQTLGEYFSIDAVTTKADCLDLVRSNEFDIIVAGERLEDGSGLELLGQLARSRPDMLRIFAAERERLKLLRGRLGPFSLFRTLAYPIEPRQLLAALSAASGAEEEAEETSTVDEAPPSPPAPARSPHKAAPKPVSVPTPASSAARARVQPSPTMRNLAPARAPAPTQTKAPVLPPERKYRASLPPNGARQLNTNTPAAAYRLEMARQQDYPRPSESSALRSALIAGAGLILVLGGLVLSYKIFNTKDEPARPAKSVSVTPQFAPEVVKLVADTEVAIQQNDFKTARNDVAALQQLAPNHPRLPFFESLLEESLLERREAALASSARAALRRKSKGRDTTSATDAASVVPTSSASSTEGSVATERPAQTISTFSGRTLEDSSTTNAAQSSVIPSQAMATPASQTGSGSATPITREARLIQRVAPEYPQDAARNGIEGAVDVAFSVSAQGKVTQVNVVHAEPSDIFNRAAIAAVRRWKYEPETENGVPIEAHLQLRLQFKLDAQTQ
jgi:TonB family protein